MYIEVSGKPYSIPCAPCMVPPKDNISIMKRRHPSIVKWHGGTQVGRSFQSSVWLQDTPSVSPRLWKKHGQPTGIHSLFPSKYSLFYGFLQTSWLPNMFLKKSHMPMGMETIFFHQSHIRINQTKISPVVNKAIPFQGATPCWETPISFLYQITLGCQLGSSLDVDWRWLVPDLCPDQDLFQEGLLMII